MPTLYVENVPEDVYKALRTRAKRNGKSIAAEVIELLKSNIPTAEELRSRREFVRRLRALAAKEPLTTGSFPSVEEMIREDRGR